MRRPASDDPLRRPAAPRGVIASATRHALIEACGTPHPWAAPRVSGFRSPEPSLEAEPRAALPQRRQRERRVDIVDGGDSWPYRLLAAGSLCASVARVRWPGVADVDG